MSPHGEILEVNKWPNQEGAMCHILTDFSTLPMLKNYWHVAHIPCVHIIPGDVHKPCHFRDSKVHITSRWCHGAPSLRIFGLRGFWIFQTSTLPILPNSKFLNWPICCHVSSWIKWPIFTSDLHPESTDLLHMSYSILQLWFLQGSGLRRSQNSTFFLENIFIRSSRSSDACPLRIDGYDSFGTPNSENLIFQKLSGPIGFHSKPLIWWRVSLDRSMVEILLGLWVS